MVDTDWIFSLIWFNYRMVIIRVDAAISRLSNYIHEMHKISFIIGG